MLIVVIIVIVIIVIVKFLHTIHVHIFTTYSHVLKMVQKALVSCPLDRKTLFGPRYYSKIVKERTKDKGLPAPQQLALSKIYI
jgi:hypothetical protein